MSPCFVSSAGMSRARGRFAYVCFARVGIGVVRVFCCGLGGGIGNAARVRRPANPRKFSSRAAPVNAASNVECVVNVGSIFRARKREIDIMS